MTNSAARNILESDGKLDEIFEHVSNGGSLITLAKLWDVSYSTIMKWLDEDSARRSVIDSAFKYREEWGKEAVLNELTKLSLSDLRDLFNKDGNLKPVDQWPENIAGAVSGLDIFEERDKDGNVIGYNKKLKLWDKKGSLDLLGKALSMFTQKIEHSGRVSLEELVSGSINDSDKDNS